MKFNINWHKKCLNNRKEYQKRMENELALLQEAVLKSQKEIDFYEFQINTAIAENKDGFDAERYKVKKEANR